MSNQDYDRPEVREQVTAEFRRIAATKLNSDDIEFLAGVAVAVLSDRALLDELIRRNILAPMQFVVGGPTRYASAPIDPAEDGAQ